MKYTACVFIPSAQEWGNEEYYLSYYHKPFELSADYYGGVQCRQYSQEEINEAMLYMTLSDMFGPVAWSLIKWEGEKQ